MTNDRVPEILGATMRSCLFVLTAVVTAAVLAPAELSAQQEELCDAAQDVLETSGLTAISEPDTIDDWRSGRILPGCRVTAAGVTARALSEEAAHFYDGVRGSGWERTPTPADAPDEASLRFRLDETDCLFNVYAQALLGTQAERKVALAQLPPPSEERYFILALCTPAVAAADS